MNPDNYTQAPQPPAALISNDPLARAETGAQPVCEIKRHPIGIAGLYIGAGFLLVVLAVLIYGVVPSVLTGYSRGQIASIGSLVMIAAALVAAGFVFMAHKIYWGNRWIVTSEGLTQIIKTGLFNKQTSQLSLADLEDLTVEQDGPLAQMFNYGVISAETAAATDKFNFPYCPRPTYYAQQILAARDRFDQSRHQAQPPAQAPVQAAPPETPPPPTETGYRVPD